MYFKIRYKNYTYSETVKKLQVTAWFKRLRRNFKKRSPSRVM